MRKSAILLSVALAVSSLAPLNALADSATAAVNSAEIENGVFSYSYTNSYENSNAFMALYDDNNALIGVTLNSPNGSIDTKGKQNVTYKLMIWDANQSPKCEPISSVTQDTTVYYNFTNQNSGLILETLDRSTSEGATLAQYKPSNYDTSQWKMIDAGNSSVNIVNRNNGMFLAAVDGELAVTSSLEKSDNNAKWKLIVQGNYYQIQNVGTDKCLDVNGKSTSEGAKVLLYTYSGASNQLWSISEFTGTPTDALTENTKAVNYVKEKAEKGSANSVYYKRVLEAYKDDFEKVAFNLKDFALTGAEVYDTNKYKWGAAFYEPTEEEKALPLGDRLDLAVKRAKAYLAAKENPDDYIMLNELIGYVSDSDKFGVSASSAECIVNDINFTLDNLEKIDSGKLSTTINPVKSGNVWLDDKGSKISAHGGQIIQANGKYYWYGEDNKVDYSLVTGLSCYSSENLTDWTYEGIVLDIRDPENNPEFSAEFLTDVVQGTKGRLERPKVIYNEKTGKYVMWAHMEKNGGYVLSAAGVAISDSPTGPFRWLHYGFPVWDKSFTSGGKTKQTYRDCNLFVDDDGTAYTVYASEENRVMYVVRLNDEYTWIDTEGMTVKTPEELDLLYSDSQYVDTETGLAYLDTTNKSYANGNHNNHLPSFTAAQMYCNIEDNNSIVHQGGRWSRIATNSREAPALIKIEGENNPNTYQLVTSGCSGWNANDCTVSTAGNVLGPYTSKGNIVTEGATSKTFHSQSTCLLKLPEGSTYDYMYMGDRWYNAAYDTSVKNSTYVWLPMTFRDDSVFKAWGLNSWYIYPRQIDPENEMESIWEFTNSLTDNKGENPFSLTGSASNADGKIKIYNGGTASMQLKNPVTSPENGMVTVDFDIYFGRQDKKTTDYTITNTDGTALVKLSLNAYAPSASLKVGDTEILDDVYKLTNAVSRDENNPADNGATHFEHIFDFESKTVIITVSSGKGTVTFTGSLENIEKSNIDTITFTSSQAYEDRASLVDNVHILTEVKNN